jgi:hypothetical protein
MLLRIRTLTVNDILKKCEVVASFKGLTKNLPKLTDDKHSKPQFPNWSWDPWPQNLTKTY